MYTCTPTYRIPHVGTTLFTYHESVYTHTDSNRAPGDYYTSVRYSDGMDPHHIVSPRCPSSRLPWSIPHQGHWGPPMTSHFDPFSRYRRPGQQPCTSLAWWLMERGKRQKENHLLNCNQLVIFAVLNNKSPFCSLYTTLELLMYT